MTRALFGLREYAPTDQEVLYATIESLSETDPIPYAPVIRLSRSFEQLPRRDGLPNEFKTFLDMVWVGHEDSSVLSQNESLPTNYSQFFSQQ